MLFSKNAIKRVKAYIAQSLPSVSILAKSGAKVVKTSGLHNILCDFFDDFCVKSIF